MQNKCCSRNVRNPNLVLTLLSLRAAPTSLNIPRFVKHPAGPGGFVRLICARHISLDIMFGVLTPL